MLERLVSEEPQQRHREGRHPAAAAATVGLTPAAGAILHAIEDIEQSHMCLLLRRGFATAETRWGPARTPASFSIGRGPDFLCSAAGTAGHARIAKHAMGHEPVPDEQHDDSTDGRADKAATLVHLDPAHGLPNEPGKERTRDSKHRREDKARWIVRARRQ